MNYYEVLVGDMAYHGADALTYASETPLAAGSIIRITLRQKLVLGVVTKKVAKPSFSVKPITASSDFPSLPSETLRLMEWLREYYPAPLGSVVRQFLPPSTSFPKQREEERENAEKPSGLPIPRSPTADLPALTNEQQQAMATISEPGSYLLHGVTGSGKSRVYLELTKKCLESGRSAVVLTPEIGLTAQLTDTFRSQFGSQVYVLHSQLTAAQRRDIWYQLLKLKEPAIVIGPRSALFSPLKNIGLIAVDESHDQAYKNESAPHYHASRVAAKLAMLHKAIFVSGSATPSIEDYYIAQAKQRPIIRMRSLAKTDETHELGILTVDLRDQNQFSRSRILSDPLLAATTEALGRDEQTLLFLNRRGTANVVLCNSCGWQMACPHCDLPLTYHGDEHRLRCHVCGFTTHLPGSCPACGNAEILLKSIGTKAVLDEVQRLFPSARLQRFDTDLQKEERLEKHIGALQEGSADIIIGTQIVAKGLDLPRLAVVGIISADSSLLIPDYTAAEHTYQLISQVAGRIGRGHRSSKLVVQSYDPTNATLQAAIQRDWDGFYKQEVAERQVFRFPPFTYLLKLNVLRATDASASKAATGFATTLQKNYHGLAIEGPTPAFHPREKGKYNWQIVVKASQRTHLLSIIQNLPSGWTYDIDPSNLL